MLTFLMCSFSSSRADREKVLFSFRMKSKEKKAIYLGDTADRAYSDWELSTGSQLQKTNHEKLGAEEQGKMQSYISRQTGRHFCFSTQLCILSI